MSFEIWELTNLGESYPECDRMKLVDRYTTREGTVAKVRTLLWEGRSVQVLVVPEGGWRRAAIERVKQA
ncbi:MAG: hypothetical protein OXK73_12975 [Rhodospirillaceae bacterium]|nr:hypothetical protein [Rhodospirillaceae bacterium]